MTHEFLWVSMYGANWIPCVVLCQNATTNEYTIRYHDVFNGDVEASVDPDYVRLVESSEDGETIPRCIE